MATKRTTRIDPNDAFKTIVGQGAGEAQADDKPPQAAPVQAAGQGRDEASSPRKLAATAEKDKKNPAAGISEAAEGLEEMSHAPPAGQTAAAGNAKEVQPAPLVQKGYYITAEQARQLAVYAAVNGQDKSSVVRRALDLFFASNQESK